MNYDLAMMALEGLAESPLSVRSENGEVVIEGSARAFKELARLMLLLGGQDATVEDGFELQQGMHAERGGLALRLRRR